MRSAGDERGQDRNDSLHLTLAYRTSRDEIVPKNIVDSGAKLRANIYVTT